MAVTIKDGMMIEEEIMIVMTGVTKFSLWILI
jgi:hypothetical protein